MPTSPLSRKLIQLIHVGKGKLDLDDDTYRHMLVTVTGQSSCSAMSLPQLQAVLAHLQARGFAPATRQTFGGRPRNTDTKDREQLLKIEALLTDADKPWAYAEAMLKHMTRGRKQRLAFADQRELNAIITALHKAACKRLAADLEQALGEEWEPLASHYARLLFGFDSAHKELPHYPQEMSEVLRWWRGTLQVCCAWPPSAQHAGYCHGCGARLIAQSQAQADHAH